MKYWLDTEFGERPCTIDLISIGIVAEDGREYYAHSSEYDVGALNKWVRENVLPYLADKAPISRAQIRNEILEFCDPEKYGKPEFWGYYCDYDWVVFCWLFGAMIDLPEGFPMYCRDIKQFADDLGDVRLPEQGKGEHDALADARWNKKAYYYLSSVACDMDT